MDRLAPSSLDLPADLNQAILRLVGYLKRDRGVA